MRETSPFSDKQAIQKRKEKKNQHSARARNLVCDNHQEKWWLLPFPCEHETLNFLRELNFADGRFLVNGNQEKCGKFLSPLTFLLYNN